MARPTYFLRRPRRISSINVLMLMLLLMTILLTACGSSSLEQAANDNKAVLDKQIAYEKSIGVPSALLQSILNQEKALNQTKPPFTLFNDQPATDYYQNLVTRYQGLTKQAKGLEGQAAKELSDQVVQNMQVLQALLNERQTQGFAEVPTFSHLYHTYSQQLAQAHYPNDYSEINTKVQDSTQSLQLLGTAADKLTQFQSLITTLKDSNMDTSALTQQADNSLALLRSATTASTFQSAIHQIDAQSQGVVTLSTQAIPYVGNVKLQELNESIKTMQQYGGDVSTFQQHLQTDRTMLSTAKTIADYLNFSSQIDSDLNAITIPTWQAKANSVVQDYHKQVTAWRNSHVYHDSFDGKDYPLGFSYDSLPDDFGEGSAIDDAFQGSQTVEDYQGVIDLVSRIEANFQAMQADYSDSTPWNQPHASDKQLMDYYKVTGGTVVIVSEIEQVARIYKNGQLIHSAQVVTGQYVRPTPPGETQVFSKQHPVRFVSGDPPGSPFYYAPTTLQYGLEFRQGGYFLHDVNWRGVFGNGPDYRVDLPHADPVDQTDGGHGSHGCVNFPLDEAAWLFANIDYGTPVIVY